MKANTAYGLAVFDFDTMLKVRSSTSSFAVSGGKTRTVRSIQKRPEAGKAQVDPRKERLVVDDQGECLQFLRFLELP